MSQSIFPLFFLPIIAALIGWVTNYLAIKMLFRPREPINFLGLTFQGVFPKRQAQIAEKLGDLVARELFSMRDLGQSIEDHSINEETLAAVGKRIEKTIREKLVSAFPMLSMFLSDEMIAKATSLFKMELEEFIRDSSKLLAKKIEGSIDVKQMVEEKVRSFSSNKIETLFLGFMQREFRFIERTGAILGFLIGCIQVFLIQAF